MLTRAAAILFVACAAGCVSGAPGASPKATATSRDVPVDRSGVRNPILDLPRRLPADGRSRATSLFETASVDPPVIEVEPIPHPVPAGVTCAIVGTGSPFPESCDPPTASAFASRSGGTPIARFTYQHVEVTWGFFESRGRAFAAIDSGGLRMRAYVDPSSILFQLTRTVEVLAGHVWLNADAPVHVARAVVGGGVQVRVDDDVHGVSDIFGAVECRDVRFDFAAPTPLVRVPTPTDPQPVVTRFAAARGDALGVFLAPGGRRITTLRHSESRPLPILAVVDESAGYARVTFDTTYASFDAWVPSAQIVEAGGGIGTGSMGACGGSRDHMGARLPRVREDTPVRVGAVPGSALTEELILAADTQVLVDEERAGFVAVTAFSEIRPPDGQQFWIPASALDR